MPKHYRECNLCNNNTINKPELVVFSASDEMLCALHIQPGIDFFLCEEHFSISDIKAHGNTKRLIEGALPLNFPKREAVLLDHSYGTTAFFLRTR